MLPSVHRNMNVLIEAGGFYSRTCGKCDTYVFMGTTWLKQWARKR